jgi:hypothetical protein
MRSGKAKPAALAALMLFLATAAHAANFCASFGAAQVVASDLTLPAKGTCAAFNGFYRNPTNAGLLLAGDVCRSSNGTTYLFNLFTQHAGLTDSLAGSWSTSNGKGSGQECFATPCLAFSVTVTKCPATVTIPASVSDLQAGTAAPSLTSGAQSITGDAQSLQSE